MTYNLLEPHVAALLRWLGTLSSNIEVHLQLPPALAALRGILNSILDQTVSTATWASMIEVGDAREQLLTHDADTLGLAARGHAARLVDQAIGQARASMFVETLGAMVSVVDHLPDDALPAALKVALRLVRRILARRPGEAAPSTGSEQMWWHPDRHHGLGNVAESAASVSDRPSSHDSGDSHRGRRLLGIHAKEHF